MHTHTHAGHKHVHPHLHEPGDETDAHGHHGLSLSPRALVVGMVHGMAGSAALMLVIIPTINSRSLGLVYILIFGIGSIGGMMLMSLLVSLPFKLTAFKFNRFNQILQGSAAAFSIILGMLIIYEKGFAYVA